MAIPRICSIPGCGKPAWSKGWCQAHYGRWKRNGDPLIGGQVTGRGEARRFYLDVVLLYEGTECLIWPFSRSAAGYGKLGDSIVSRLVCDRAHGPAPTPTHDAAHSCGNGDQGCVTKRHLSWKTHAENGADMVAHGSSPRGERHGSAKLTEDQVREIRALKGRQRQREIAERFEISEAAVGMIQAGRRWAWL